LNIISINFSVNSLEAASFAEKSCMSEGSLAPEASCFVGCGISVGTAGLSGKLAFGEIAGVGTDLIGRFAWAEDVEVVEDCSG
jgi:hypothetical protein